MRAAGFDTSKTSPKSGLTPVVYATLSLALLSKSNVTCYPHSGCVDTLPIRPCTPAPTRDGPKSKAGLYTFRYYPPCNTPLVVVRVTRTCVQGRCESGYSSLLRGVCGAGIWFSVHRQWGMETSRKTCGNAVRGGF